MKKNFFQKLTIIFLLSIIVYSCSDDINHEFSHDDSINQWAIKNKKDLIKLERKQIKKLNLEKQKAVLRLMPAAKRKKIWSEKIEYITNLDLSEKEKEFIYWFKEKFSKISYKEPISEKFSEELYNKLIIGIEKFNWTEEFAFKTFFTVGDVDVSLNKTSKEVEPQNLKFQQGEPTNCYCRYSLSCSGWNNSCVAPDKCVTNNYNCGVFGTSSCTGYCNGNIEHE